MSTGPLLKFSVNGAERGEVIPTSDELSWELMVASPFPVETLEVAVNGNVVWQSEGLAEPGKKTFQGTLNTLKGGWIAARAHGGEEQWTGMNGYRFAHTSPLWIGERGSTDPEVARKAAQDLLRALDVAEKRLVDGYGDTSIPKNQARFSEARRKLEQYVQRRWKKMPEVPPPITSPPSSEELAQRLEKVRTSMTKNNLDAYVSFDPVNIYYLTNFAFYVHERPFLLIINKYGPPVMLAPKLELNHVRMRARLELEYAAYYEFPAPKGENWYEVSASIIPEGGRVGIESAMPVGIASKTPGKHVVLDIIDEIRLIKTDYEIGRTVHACGILNLGHQKLLEVCKPGVPEIAIYNNVVGSMMGHIFQDIPGANTIVTKFLAAVWTPSISHDPHLIPTPMTLMEEGGPHVSIINGQVDGYGVELERTFFLGKVPEHAKRPFEVMLKARQTAYDMAKPGTVLAEIDESVRKVIIDAGYGDHILHRTGHGFGVTSHEAPFLALGDERQLAPGMIMSIEPGIYIPGEGGYRHSDTVWITEEGPVRLTEAPESLEELTLG